MTASVAVVPTAPEITSRLWASLIVLMPDVPHVKQTEGLVPSAATHVKSRPLNGMPFGAISGSSAMRS